MGKIPFLLNMGKCVTNSWVTKVLNHHLLTDDSLKSEMHLIYYFKKKHIFENKRQSPVRKENEGTLEPRSEYSYWVNRCFRRTEDITGNSICSLFASPTRFHVKRMLISSSEVLLDNHRHGKHQEDYWGLSEMLWLKASACGYLTTLKSVSVLFGIKLPLLE